MVNFHGKDLLAETEKFLGNGLTSEERVKVNTAIRNIGKELSETDRYNWKEKFPEIVKNNNLGCVAVCLASSIVRQDFKSQKLQSWANEILDKWKWAGKERIDKSAFRPQGHRTIIWDMAEKFIEMTSTNLEQTKENNSEKIETSNDYTLWRKDVAKMVLDSDYNATTFFENYNKKYGITDTLDTETFSKFANTFTQDLKDKNFFMAYMDLKNSASPFFRAFTDIDFMKAVVKEHGTDTATLTDAINIITDIEKETPEFTSKLLNETLNTDEYKRAFDKEQNKTAENIR